MKAYVVYDVENHEGYQDIVFGNSVREIKKNWHEYESCEDADYIDVRVERRPIFDGLENLTHKELMYEAILNGWWYQYEDNIYTEDNIDEAVELGIVTPYSETRRNMT